MFVLTGKVTHGKRNGSTVGMPTANLETNEQPLPPLGVYASRVTLTDGTYIGVTNVGYRPTVDDDMKITVETFIIGCNEDLYGDSMKLELCFFLRPTIKMHSLDEVKHQVKRDCAMAICLLSSGFEPSKHEDCT